MESELVNGERRPRVERSDHDGDTSEGTDFHGHNTNDGPLYCSLEMGEIRILEILPGLEEDTVECRLKTVELNWSEYSTLSYTWGAPHETQSSCHCQWAQAGCD
jgi:hypothetical protein